VTDLLFNNTTNQDIL